MVHVFKIIGRREQEEKAEKEREKQKKSAVAEGGNEMDNICQLIDMVDAPPREHTHKPQVRLEYRVGFKLDFARCAIRSMSLSPRNQHLLISLGNEGGQGSHYVFQLGLFLQLSNADPLMFGKPLRNIYKPK